MDPEDDILSAEEREALAVTADAPPPADAPPADAPPSDTPPADASPANDPPIEGQVRDPETGKFVPHAALHEERGRRKAAEERLQLAERRLNMLFEKLGKSDATPTPTPAPAPAAIPDPEADPVSAIKHVMERLPEIERSVTDFRSSVEATNEEQALVGGFEAAEAAFAAQVPDYEQAADHYASSRIRELRMFMDDPNEIAETLQGEMLTMARQARQFGKNPAEMVYRLAEARGYRKAASAPDPAAPTATADAAVSAIERGQQQTRSLGSAPGAAPAGDLSLKTLVDMSEEEFAEYLSTKEGQKAFRKVAGA